jgi:hypothetical protein
VYRIVSNCTINKTTTESYYEPTNIPSKFPVTPTYETSLSTEEPTPTTIRETPEPATVTYSTSKEPKIPFTVSESTTPTTISSTDEFVTLSTSEWPESTPTKACDPDNEPCDIATTNEVPLSTNSESIPVATATPSASSRKPNETNLPFKLLPISLLPGDSSNEILPSKTVDDSLTSPPIKITDYTRRTLLPESLVTETSPTSYPPTAIGDDEQRCVENSLHPHPFNCRKYYICIKRILVMQTCSGVLEFSSVYLVSISSVLRYISDACLYKFIIILLSLPH